MSVAMLAAMAMNAAAQEKLDGEDSLLIAELLDSAYIASDGARFDVEKEVWSFSKADVAKAMDARELVSKIPGLHIDEMTGNLTRLDGKKVLILINGVKAKDSDLQLIRPGKVIKVDFYDVPPIRYADMADAVVNVKVRQADDGWTGSVYGRIGQMYNLARASVAYNNGNNKYTVGYSGLLNQKMKRKDLESGSWAWTDGDGISHKYDYDEKQSAHGLQNSVTASWLNSVENAHIFQVEAGLSFNRTVSESDKSVGYGLGDVEQDRTGSYYDKVKYVSPTLDLYWEKPLSETSALIFDLTGTLYATNQDTRSVETAVTGSGGFESLSDLDADKRSVIAEAVYSTAIKGTTLQLGYRGKLSGMDNSVTGSGTGSYGSDISTGEHRAYAEAVWRHGNWSAQGSMAAELHSTKTATGSDRSFDFTPSLMLNYKIDKNNSLRLDLSSATESPEMQQLSEWRVQVMEGLYRTGNPDLRTSASYEAGLRYAFQIPGKLVARIRGFMAEDRRHIFMNIVRDGADLSMRYENADYYRERGARVTLSWYLAKWLTLGAQADLVRQYLFADSFSEKEKHTFFRPTLNVGLNFGKLSASYMQTLANDYLNGLYIEGWENVSSISLTYKAKKNLRIGLQCLFPFIEDNVSVKSIAQAPVKHDYELDMRTKNQSLGLTISWNFTHGKAINASKSLFNSDEDTGKFTK